MTDHLIVAVVAVISGGFAIPVGFLLDLPALETYLAAAAALVGMLVFVFIGAGLRDWIVERLNISEEKLQGGKEMLGKYELGPRQDQARPRPWALQSGRRIP